MSSKFNFSDRVAEIPRMIEILAAHKDWKSLTFFQYKGGNADLVKPITRIRLTKRHKKTRTNEFLLTIGVPNYAEREYIRKFRKQHACWPDDTYKKFPAKRRAA